MLNFSPKQFATMAGDARKGFLLEAVSDWFALVEACYQKSPRLTFDVAWNIADHLLDQIEGLPQPITGPVDYAFIRAVLDAAEAGTAPDQLRTAVATFCRALPADEAAFILFESMCDVSTTPTGVTS